MGLMASELVAACWAEWVRAWTVETWMRKAAKERRETNRNTGYNVGRLQVGVPSAVAVAALGALAVDAARSES